MTNRWLHLTAAVGLISGGCAGMPHHFSSPGTIEQQQRRATIHDPYADPFAAPNLETRPRDYSTPLPVPVQNRIYVDSWWGR